MLSFGSKQLSTSLSLLKSYIWITKKLLRLLKIVLSGKTHFIKYKFIKKEQFQLSVYYIHNTQTPANFERSELPQNTNLHIFVG